ncbi:nucleoside-diphosphate-sugar epimerase [Elusimicrobium posterum]|uniref:NAD-dependent epimerase/dehydratase family protein n=1 Tax=Elusimicrobium posterum TaxID=3116653 RepID=UPI003C73BD7A
MKLLNKTVLITGAGGFIGHHIVRVFSIHGARVYALIHKNLPPEFETMQNVTVIKGSISAPGILADILNQIGGAPDIVVHAAGLASDVGADKIYKELNYESVKKFASFAKKKFIFISSSDVYGIKDFNGEDEDSLPYETRPLSPYPKYKIESEKWLKANLPKNKYAILRPAAVWGEGDKTIGRRFVSFLSASPFIFNFGKWKGQNRWPAADVENVAKVAYVCAAYNDFDGQAINIIDEEHISIDAYYRRVGAKYLPGKKFTSVTLPFWFGKFLGFISTTLSNMLGRTVEVFDPSYYAVHHVASNLDLSCERQNKALNLYNKPDAQN